MTPPEFHISDLVCGARDDLHYTAVSDQYADRWYVKGYHWLYSNTVIPMRDELIVIDKAIAAANKKLPQDRQIPLDTDVIGREEHVVFMSQYRHAMRMYLAVVRTGKHENPLTPVLKYV